MAERKKTPDILGELLTDVEGKDVKPASKAVSHQDGKPVSHTKKATYYIRKDLIKRLKFLGAERERDLSDLVNEAIEELLKQYNQ